MRRWCLLATALAIATAGCAHAFAVIPDDGRVYAPISADAVRVMSCSELPRPYSVVGIVAVESADGSVVPALRKAAADVGANYLVNVDDTGQFGIAVALRAPGDVPSKYCEPSPAR